MARLYDRRNALRLYNRHRSDHINIDYEHTQYQNIGDCYPL